MLKLIQINRHWLTSRRIKLYSGIAIAFFTAFFFGFIRYSNLVDPKGYTIISDLTVFWVAAHFGLAGHASAAYSIPQLREAVLAIDQGVKGSFGWFYPPTFYLLILPLGILPYLPAYLAFMLPTLACYVLVIYRIVPRNETLWILGSFSGIWMNLLRGQNGFLTAALAGAALLCMERRPILSGILFGLLIIKPHLALLFPVALIAIGAWRILLIAAAVSIGFMVTGTAILGVNTFSAWLHAMNAARELMEGNGPAYWTHMPTIFSFFRLIGAPITVSYGAHMIVASCAIASVWWVWRHCTSLELRGAVLTAATCLVSPYLLEYDLTWIALPIAWLSKHAMQYGWLRGEREVMVAAWITPFTMGYISQHFVPINIGPLVLIGMLWIVVRRVRVITGNRVLLENK